RADSASARARSRSCSVTGARRCFMADSPQSKDAPDEAERAPCKMRLITSKLLKIKRLMIVSERNVAIVNLGHLLVNGPLRRRAHTGRRRAHLAITAAADELHVGAVHVQGRALIAVAVGPLSQREASLDVDGLALLEVLVRD